MTNKVGKNKLVYIFGVILIFQLIFMIYMGYKKEGYHVDEIWSYGLANNYYQPFLYESDDYIECLNDDFYNRWIDNKLFKDYITVSDDERFSYGSVFYNQSKDSHPPLYYSFIHTISSIFTGAFNKWMGLALNYILFILGSIFLFKLSMWIIGKNYYALLPCFMWGLSYGGASSVLYIRMYLMLTVAVIIFTYVQFKYFENEKPKLRQSVAIFLATIAGVLTQYYFLIYAFFLCLVIFIYMILKKQWDKLIKYSSIMFLSLATSILIFPSIIRQLFMGRRGSEALNNLSDKSYIDYLFKYLNVINDEALSSCGYLLLILVVVVIFIYFIQKNGKIKLILPYKKVDKKIVFLLITSLFYVLMIVKLIPKDMGNWDSRYFFCVYPLLCFLFTYLMKHIINLLIIEKKYKKLIIAGVVLILSTNIYTVSNNCRYFIKYNYLNQNVEIKDKYQVERDLKDSYCVFVSDNEWSVHSLVPELRYCYKIFPICKGSTIDKDKFFDGVTLPSEIMVVATDNAGVVEQLKTLKSITGYNNIINMYTRSGFTKVEVYKISK